MKIFYLHPLGSITSWNTDPITNTFLWPGPDSTSDAYSTIKTKHHHAACTWSDPTNQKGLWIAISIKRCTVVYSNSRQCFYSLFCHVCHIQMIKSLNISVPCFSCDNMG